MAVYEYPEYEAHAALVRSTYERFERLHARLEDLKAQWAQLNIEAQGGDGDVMLSVNHKGQLTSLSLAEGCTARYTHLGLEELINTTLHEAVKAAVAESDAITDAADATSMAELQPHGHSEG
ncbi:YbaB/EbfC family nucleoid-associated protein [Mycobacterium haemophilum]